MSDTVEVPLHAVAHSRAGDKGNRANLSLIPYRPELYPLLAEQVTDAGYAVVALGDGAAALAWLDGHSPDLLVSYQIRLVGSVRPDGCPGWV